MADEFKETESEKPLPTFRKDLQLFPAPSNPDGSPSFSLFDPIKAQYYQINWAESLALALHQPGMTISQLIAAIEDYSTIKVDREELIMFFQEAQTSNLLDVPRPSETMVAEAKKIKVGWFKWLLYHYLYIRIPLINPDQFLTRTLHYVSPLFSPLACAIYASIFLIGIIMLAFRFEEFLHTFTYFFNVEGFLIYAITITAIKLIHEFSHAYVAKYNGIYVPTMGVALIIFWPVLYTDVTDSWRLAKRSQRMAISAAGIIAESTIAGLFTIGWALSSPGILQSLFFVVCSTTWISTLVVNLNPALRFDGYYIFTDLVGIDNLQPRSFAMTRWQLRKWLLGINVRPPEEHASPTRIAIMMVYSIYTWIYRVFLYTAIAIFIYLQFTKILGIFLFIVEVAIFLLWPLFSEIKQLNLLRPHMSWNTRSIITTTVVGLFLFWFIVPLPHRESYPAVVVARIEQLVYVPFDAKVEEIYVKRQDDVHVGQPLIKLVSIALLTDIVQAELDKSISEKESMLAAENEKDRVLVKEKENTIAALNEKLKALKGFKDQLLIQAEINGEIYAWDETLTVDQHIAKDQIVGRIADFNSIEAVAFIPEKYIQDVYLGQKVTFRVNRTFEKIEGQITQINPIRSQHLIYRQLASVHSGDIPVKEQAQSQNLTLVESYYSVHVELEKDNSVFIIGQKGYVDVRGVWRSRAFTLLKDLWALLIRELNF